MIVIARGRQSASSGYRGSRLVYWLSAMRVIAERRSLQIAAIARAGTTRGSPHSSMLTARWRAGFHSHLNVEIAGARADLLAVLVAHQGCDAARDKIDDENGIVAEHNRGLSHTGIRAKATPVIGRSSRSRAGCFWRWCGGTGLPSSPADICTKREISPLRARAISGRRLRAF